MWTRYRDTVYEVHKLGLVRNINTKQILAEHIHKGHPRVQMYINGIKKNRPIHILTAELYVQRIPNKDDSNKIVNHRNGIKIDTWYGNFEWTTVSGNTKHAVDMGFIDMNRVRSFKQK